MKIGILGAGTWGVALAALLSRNGHLVTVWSHRAKGAEQLRATRTHPNLQGVLLPQEIIFTADMSEAVSECELVILVVPSSTVRETAEACAPFLKDNCMVACASKGIERGTRMTMTEIMQDVFSALRPEAKLSYIALSGPTHAEEVAQGLPTSIVSACEDETVAMNVAKVFFNSCMRVYTNTDVRGVEICGALKNIIAIAAGINRGMGLGDNAQAMLMTRGISEMTRVGLAMGCRRRTFMGLAGIGDLIVTCTSVHSRNNRCGELIGRGKSYEEAQREIGMVVEGYHALEAAMELSREYGVEMPITHAVYEIIHEGRKPEDAMRELMQRDIKNELEV